MREEFEKVVLASTKRIRHLADGLEYAPKIKGFPRDFTALKEYFIHEIGASRKALWPFREEPDGHFVDECTKSLEDAIKAVRERDFKKASFALNTAYGFLSRISISVSDLDDELHFVERAAWWKGISHGLMAGFALGFGAMLVAAAIFFLGK